MSTASVRFWIAHLLLLTTVGPSACSPAGCQKSKPKTSYPDFCVQRSFNGSGDLVFTLTRSFDEQGRLLREEEDSGTMDVPPDGQPEFVTVRTWSTQGQLLRKELDVADNGSVNKIATYTYDDTGRLVREELDWLGGLPDGKVDQIISHEYDAAGHETAVESTSDEPTLQQRRIYLVDEAGRKLQEELQVGPDRQIVKRTSYVRDARGEVVLEEADGAEGPMDGRPDLRIRYLFDDQGRQAGEEIDVEADGSVDYRVTYRYDGSGNLLEKRSVDAAGIVQSRLTYDYGCFRQRPPTR